MGLRFWGEPSRALRGLAVFVAALGACGLLGCAAGGSGDVGVPVEDSGPGEGGAVDEEAGPSVFDAGPPATIVNGGGADSSIEPIPDGGCTSLAQCPYEDAANVAAVACTVGVCGITCKGETYDVNGDASDGCEIVGACQVGNGTMLCPVDDHSENNAASVGSFSCDDSASAQNLTGTIPSDERAHLPTIDGFVAGTGSAPNFFNIFGTGGLTCEDDANFTLQMNAPTKQMACYVLTLITDKQTQTCTTDASGTCSISNGSGSYEDNSTIYVEVSKAASCSGSEPDAGPDAGDAGTDPAFPPSVGFPDDGTYTITGHL